MSLQSSAKSNIDTISMLYYSSLYISIRFCLEPRDFVTKRVLLDPVKSLTNVDAEHLTIGYIWIAFSMMIVVTFSQAM